MIGGRGGVRCEVRRLNYMSSDGFNLVGILCSPQEPIGWALMAHGILESKDEYGAFYVDLSQELASQRIGSLRFDFRGHGESSGDSRDISIKGDILDLKASLGQLPIKISEKFAIVATSFGAGPAILLASEIRSRVSGLALIAPVLDYKRTFLEPETPWTRESFTPQALASADSGGELLLNGSKPLSPALIQEFRSLHPEHALETLNLPTLIIHGTKDSMVPFAVSKAAAAPSRSIRLVELENADHGFTDFEDDTDVSPKSLENRRKLVSEASSFVLRSFNK